MGKHALFDPSHPDVLSLVDAPVIPSLNESTVERLAVGRDSNHKTLTITMRSEILSLDRATLYLTTNLMCALLPSNLFHFATRFSLYSNALLVRF